MKVYFNILCTFSMLFLGFVSANDETSPQPAFADIPAGKFAMGSHENEEGRWGDERQHWVTLTNDIQMQTTEMTQLQYFRVMGTNPSYFKEIYHCPDDYEVLIRKSVNKKGETVVTENRMCPNHPVESVSWFDVRRFIAKLNVGEEEYLYRLPTEAEWEYAARAGTEWYFQFGPYISTTQANYHGGADYKYSFKGEYRAQTVAVGSFDANPWGLHDMHGNVWEWVYDAYGDYFMEEYSRLRRAPIGTLAADMTQHRRTVQRENPRGAQVGPGRVVRGGSWNSGASSLRFAYRYYMPPNEGQNDLGFRLVRVPLNPVAPSENSEGESEAAEAPEESEAAEDSEESEAVETPEEHEESGESQE